MSLVESFRRQTVASNLPSPSDLNSPKDSKSRRTARLSATLIVICGCLLGGCGGKNDNDALLRQQRRSRVSETKSTTERLAIAQKRLENGNIEEAEAISRSLLIATPNDPQVILLAASCQAARGDAIAAAEMVDDIGQDDPEIRVLALRQAVYWLIEAELLDQAYVRLQTLLKLEPSNRIRHKITTVLNNQGRSLETKPYLRELAKSGDATESELYAMLCFADAFLSPAEPPPQDDRVSMKWLGQAKSEYADGNRAEAFSISLQLVAAYPESTAVAAFHGRMLDEIRDRESFLQWTADLPEGIRKEPEYWRAIGAWKQRDGKHPEAIRCYAEALRLDDTDRYAYLGLAKSLAAVGETERAAKLTHRYELLDESARIGAKIGRAPGTRAELLRLAAIVDELGRPWEAIAWTEVANRLYGVNEIEQKKLQARRDELKDAADSADEATVLCGLDLSRWPLPDSVAPESRPEPDRNRSLAEPGSIGPIRLTQVDASVGLNFEFRNGDEAPDDGTVFLHQLTGGGIGVIDYDLDGRPDVYFAQAGGDAFDAKGSTPNQLRRNHSGTTFVDVTEVSGTGDLGYGQGVTAADMNQDGFPDLLVANLGTNLLYFNNGDGTFRRTELPSDRSGDGKFVGEWTTSIAAGDLNGDHLPEIVEVNYVDDVTALTTPCVGSKSLCSPKLFTPASDRLLWNSAQGVFVRADKFSAPASHGFAAVIANFDQSNGNELFVANDADRNHYWRSSSNEDRSDERFRLVECARVSGCATGLNGAHHGCMGIAAGDFDRNGRLDLHVTNFWNQPADLYLQSEDGLFANQTVPYGVYDQSRRTVGWGTQAVDFDHDGWLDLAVLNGHVTERGSGEPFKMRPQLFQGTVNRFRLVDDRSLGGYWSTSNHGRTMATLDWNGDGKLDLLTNHLHSPAVLLQNQTEGGNGLQLEVIGTASERDAIGATIRARIGDVVLTKSITGGDGFLCSNEAVEEFGIGSFDQVDELTVTWPSGASTSFTDVGANQRYVAVEGQQELFQR